MEKKTNWEAFQTILSHNGITRLYHFTDRENLASIISNGGLYSWADCEAKHITIPKPGGGSLSRNLDTRARLQDYVRCSFVKEHPMKYVAMQEGRIDHPILLEISPEVVSWEETRFSDRNAADNGAQVGSALEDLQRIHFDVFEENYFDLTDEDKHYYQAEVMVKHFIPLSAITNIGNFGISLPAQPLSCKPAYTAQITRATPTAFIFLVDQSVSMQRNTTLYGETMPMSEAVARIVNHQLNELVLRCIKGSETRDYYDIAVIGYGVGAYSGWEGELKGRFFVKPSELKDHPYKRIITRKSTKTRRGEKVVEVEEVQWIEPHAHQSWTHFHEAFEKAKELLDEWMEKYHDKDCYPPTIIHITDGIYNGAKKEEVLQRANELKALFTNDGNVILFNIHISTDGTASVLFPHSKGELDNAFAKDLFDMSSMLPSRYSERISELRGGTTPQSSYAAMSINADMGALIQLMDIGTPTNITQAK